ncbi:hypothetical protein HC891_26390, partial [Candidatus Gracilibacteria bacterium]|nr:hypothetical protein [Candidatus Gracilibacteria bacterium]
IAAGACSWPLPTLAFNELADGERSQGAFFAGAKMHYSRACCASRSGRRASELQRERRYSPGGVAGSGVRSQKSGVRSQESGVRRSDSILKPGERSAGCRFCGGAPTMSERATVTVAPRFTRAIHIRRDFHDMRHRLDGYQVTPLVRQLAGRISAGLQSGSTERAFSVVGPFGSGKSAFGVFVAHFLQRDEDARRQLLGSLGVADDALLPLDTPSLLAVLVAGNNSSLRHAVLASLGESLAKPQLRTPAIDRLRQRLVAAQGDSALDPQRVADLLAEAAGLLKAQGHYQGVLLLVDELGQYLDYAARQDEERDLFVLQSLAEMAARSGAAPMLVVTILHQAFERYNLNAGATRRIEWAKVQGRFVDLPFQEPSSQMLRMIAAALRPLGRDRYRAARTHWADHLAPAADVLGLRPAEIGVDEWRQIIADSYPIHPSVLVALPTLFRQLAQNERSLFAFLHADEPWALRDVLGGEVRSQESEFRRSHPSELTQQQLPIYRLTHLFSYVETSLGPSLFGRARGQRWAELAEARSALSNDEALLQDTLTVVGTIGALERASGLRANAAQVAFALGGEFRIQDSGFRSSSTNEGYSSDQVADALLTLQRRQLLSYRQHRDSYIVWEGSDLDLDALTQEERRELGERASLAGLLLRHADSTPRIARRHSYRTGATRTFAVRYVEATALNSALAPLGGFDGELLHIVPADDEELRAAERWALDDARKEETGRIAVLPQRVRELRELLLDVAALRRLLDERAELEHDRSARREVAGRLIEAQQALTTVIAETYGGERGRWFYRHKPEPIGNARQIDTLLSAAADSTYPQTPQVWNELIVRRQLSSAAAKARRNLVEAMLTHADRENLGLVGYPPARAVYESVLRAGGLHQQDATGTWCITAPSAGNELRLYPAWQALEEALATARAEPQALKTLFELLEAPPYGVKGGLTPLLFVALYITRAGEINLYERGNYVPTPDMAMFERLLTRPEHFAVRLSRADGARKQVYERLAQALAPRALELPVQPALLAVAMPLLRILNGLPAYSKQTRQISAQAQAVRQAVREARSPDELLFELLPLACGLTTFASDEADGTARVEAFAAALKAAVQELQTAYPQLIETIGEVTGTAFGLRTSGTHARSELQARYELIAATSNDSQLRGLGVRLETADAEGNAWLESLAALVMKRPPELWGDSELPAFRVAIAELGRRFQTAEELAVAARAVPAEAPLLRIGLASGSGEI